MWDHLGPFYCLECDIIRNYPALSRKTKRKQVLEKVGKVPLSLRFSVFSGADSSPVNPAITLPVIPRSYGFSFVK